MENKISAKKMRDLAKAVVRERDQSEIDLVLKEIKNQATNGCFCAEFDSLGSNTISFLEEAGFQVKENLLLTNISVGWY